MSVNQPRYEVTVRRDPDDARYWLVNVVDEQGAQTFGRSLAEAKRNAIEVIALWSDLEPEAFDVDWDIQLGSLADTVEKAREAMAHAEEDKRRRGRSSACSHRGGVIPRCRRVAWPFVPTSRADRQSVVIVTIPAGQSTSLADH